MDHDLRVAGDTMEVVRPPASYELVVEQIRRAIQLGRFGPGQKLPPERELAGQLGVSRTTVREAMRVLQGEGLVEIRRGRAGGAVVVGVTLSQAELKRLLRHRLTELEALVEHRLIIEPATARLAAQRRSERQVQELHRLVEAMSALAARATADGDASPPSAFFALDSQFHHRIAEGTGNPMLVRAVDDVRAALFTPVGGIFGALHPDANAEHETIFAAIAVGDPDAAEEAMARHIQLTQAALQSLTGTVAGSGRR